MLFRACFGQSFLGRCRNLQDVNEFADFLHYGYELVFTYHGQEFFIQGWNENNKHPLILDRWEPPSDGYIWTSSAIEGNEFPSDEFLNARLWNGRACF